MQLCVSADYLSKCQTEHILLSVPFALRIPLLFTYSAILRLNILSQLIPGGCVIDVHHLAFLI